VKSSTKCQAEAKGSKQPWHD